jgi:hypothetical protein
MASTAQRTDIGSPPLNITFFACAASITSTTRIAVARSNVRADRRPDSE